MSSRGTYSLVRDHSLFRLDRKDLYRQPVVLADNVDREIQLNGVDFLVARCNVISEGRATYERVLPTPVHLR